MKSALLSIATLASLASAHFSVKYPASRGETLDTQTQSQSPCGGLDAPTTSRTPWPLNGGSLLLQSTHLYSTTSVNLGNGTGVDTSNEFPISLVPAYNQTGAGMFCLPQIAIPKGVQVTDGMNASLQVKQIPEDGEATYNCVDITFKADAVLLTGTECINSTGVSATFLKGNPSGKGGSLKNTAPLMESIDVGMGAWVMALALTVVSAIV